MKLGRYIMEIFKRQKNTKRMNENGLTLIEVLASVVLLTIIITIFLNVFIQSAQTNSTSEEVVDATYLAQTEMERIYEVSQRTEYTERERAIESLNYESLTNEEEWLFFGKEINENYYAKVQLQQGILNEQENMNRLIISIHSESATGKTQVQMENILLWGDGLE